MNASLPSAVPLNEDWTTVVINDYSGTNWRRGNPGSVTTASGGPSNFIDFIEGENVNLPPTPPTVCPGAGQAVDHWGQEWRIGSLAIGVGARVQTDTIQKYTNHAEHQNIVSPAP